MKHKPLKGGAVVSHGRPVYTYITGSPRWRGLDPRNYFQWKGPSVIIIQQVTWTSPDNFLSPPSTPPCITFLPLIGFSVLIFRTTCTEWSTSSWWTSTRMSGAWPLPPCLGHPGPTAVSPPDEPTASPTGTRDFSLFSRRAEPHWKVAWDTADRLRQREGERGSTGVTTQPKTGSGTCIKGVILWWGSFCTLCPVTFIPADDEL